MKSLQRTALLIAAWFCLALTFIGAYNKNPLAITISLCASVLLYFLYDITEPY